MGELIAPTKLDAVLMLLGLTKGDLLEASHRKGYLNISIFHDEGYLKSARVGQVQNNDTIYGAESGTWVSLLNIGTGAKVCKCYKCVNDEDLREEDEAGRKYVLSPLETALTEYVLETSTYAYWKEVAPLDGGDSPKLAWFREQFSVKQRVLNEPARAFLNTVDNVESDAISKYVDNVVNALTHNDAAKLFKDESFRNLVAHVDIYADWSWDPDVDILDNIYSAIKAALKKKLTLTIDEVNCELRELLEIKNK